MQKHANWEGDLLQYVPYLYILPLTWGQHGSFNIVKNLTIDTFYCVKFLFYSVHFLLLSDMKGHVHEFLQDSHMFSDLTVYRGENMLSHSSICLSDSNVKKNVKIFLNIFQPYAKKKKRLRRLTIIFCIVSFCIFTHFYCCR